MTEFKLKEYLERIQREDRERAAAQSARDAVQASLAEQGYRVDAETAEGVAKTLGSPSVGLMQTIRSTWSDSFGYVQEPERPALQEQIDQISHVLATMDDDIGDLQVGIGERVEEFEATKIVASGASNTADTALFRVNGLVTMHQELEKHLDMLRDRLYAHEKDVKKTVDEMDTRVTALESFKNDLLADPSAAFKIQYRFGREQWKDYEPDAGNYLSIGSGDGRSIIQLRMVRK